MLWAFSIKSMDKPITGNYCFGGEYIEDETLQEVRFLREYLKVLPKEVKYYIGKDYAINSNNFKILDMYEEFLKDNLGFTKVENTKDLKLPNSIKINLNSQEIIEKIENVLDTGKLFELTKLL